MLAFIIGFFLFLTVYKNVSLFLIRRRLRNRRTVPILNGAEPFLLNGKKKVGVLLLHGFSATPHELQELGDFLNSKGYPVYAPLLSGHGRVPETLLDVRGKDWEKDVDRAIQKLGRHCSKIVIVGNSFGGNLAFLCGSQKRKVHGIVALASPFIFSQHDFVLRTFFEAMRHVKLFQKKKYDERSKKIYEKTGRIVYDQIPLRSFIEVLKIVTKSKKILPSVKKSVLLMQSTTDPVVSRENLDYVYDLLPTKDKRKVWVPNSIHVFISDKHKSSVFKEIAHFCQSL